jgi:hypothetical protein
VKATIQIPRGWRRLRNGTKRKHGDRDLGFRSTSNSRQLRWLDLSSGVGYVTDYSVVIRRKGKS